MYFLRQSTLLWVIVMINAKNWCVSLKFNSHLLLFFGALGARPNNCALAAAVVALKRGFSRLNHSSLFNLRWAAELNEWGLNVFLFISQASKQHRLKRYHSQTYGNGSKCDLNGNPRETEVRVRRWKIWCIFCLLRVFFFSKAFHTVLFFF